MGLTFKYEKTPDGKTEIKCIGLRLGEKSYEELVIGDNALGTSQARIIRAEEVTHGVNFKYIK